MVKTKIQKKTFTDVVHHVTVRSVSRRTDVNRRPFTALRSEGVNDSIVARRQPLVILLLIRPKCIDRFVFKLSVGLPCHELASSTHYPPPAPGGGPFERRARPWRSRRRGRAERRGYGQSSPASGGGNPPSGSRHDTAPPLLTPSAEGGSPHLLTPPQSGLAEGGCLIRLLRVRVMI